MRDFASLIALSLSGCGGYNAEERERAPGRERLERGERARSQGVKVPNGH